MVVAVLREAADAFQEEGGGDDADGGDHGGARVDRLVAAGRDVEEAEQEDAGAAVHPGDQGGDQGARLAEDHRAGREQGLDALGAGAAFALGAEAVAGGEGGGEEDHRDHREDDRRG